MNSVHNCNYCLQKAPENFSNEELNELCRIKDQIYELEKKIRDAEEKADLYYSRTKELPKGFHCIWSGDDHGCKVDQKYCKMGLTYYKNIKY